MEEVRFIAKKLITKEDPQYIHKVLGLSALLSYFYRYAIVYPNQGDLGLDPSDWFTWATMAIHWCLSCSAIIFHVLPRRLIHTPIIIWEEYRLHAIVFTTKTTMVFLWGALQPLAGYGANTNIVAFFFLMCAHHLVVDEISRRYGTPEVTTVRVKDEYHIGRKLIQRFYAFYQIAAFACVLTPTTPKGMMELGFNSLIAIQSSAFLMTLCRKNIISSLSHGTWYFGALVLSLYHIFRIHNSWTFAAAAFAAFVGRTMLRLNKYLVWTIYVFGPIAWAHYSDRAPLTMMHDALNAGGIDLSQIQLF